MHIALKNGSNIALLNAMGHVIIEENLYDKAFVASRTEGFEEYRKIVEGYTRSRLKISPASAPVRFVRRHRVLRRRKAPPSCGAWV